MADIIIDGYTSNMVGTYSTDFVYESNWYKCKIYQNPAFLMQLLAAYQGQQINKTSFLRINVASYLEQAKSKIVSAAIGGMEHPHFVESYYLLATKLT